METSKVVFLPKGSVGEIITYLNNRNFKVNKFDKYIVALMGKPQSGWIDIGSQNISKFDFLYKLTTAKAAMVDITLVPGYTSLYFFKEISEKLGLSYEKLAKEYANLIGDYQKDGYFYPETYKVPVGISERHLIYYLFNNSRQKFKELSQKIFGEFDEKKWNNYIIIASIIQKEAASESEMPLVASVIYNRLKIGMKLEMDGTLNYGIYSSTKVTAQRIREDKSKFNTYLHQGLPPSPVCNVSVAAIKAAIFPAKSEFLFFVRDRASGKHKFSKSYQEHLRNIK